MQKQYSIFSEGLTEASGYEYG